LECQLVELDVSISTYSITSPTQVARKGVVKRGILECHAADTVLRRQQ